MFTDNGDLIVDYQVVMLVLAVYCYLDVRCD